MIMVPGRAARGGGSCRAAGPAPGQTYVRVSVKVPLPQVGAARNVTGVTEEPPRGTGGPADRDKAALDDLRWHWGTAYDIGFDGKCWTAQRGTTGRLLSSETPYGLRDLIVSDYSARPRPAGDREPGGPGARGGDRDRP